MSVPEVAKAPERVSLAWVSWLRVLAITAVVLIHVAGLSAVFAGGRSTTVGRVGIVLDFGSRWAVPVFVMLSGTLLLDPARFRGASDFLRRRAWRLVPPVVFWHAVYLALVVVQGQQHLDAATLTRRILTGQLWTALYFFWIVLGLALVTPVLVPWLAASGRVAHLVVGLAAALMTCLTLLTVPVRDAPLAWVETPWTWWVPYLGFYLLGFALRDVVLPAWGVVLGALTAAVACALLALQWRQHSGMLGALERHSPAESYYSPTVLLISVCVFLVARGLVRPDGALAGLARGAPARVGRRLGDATLGVFGVHLLVLEVVLRLPVVGGERGATSVGLLVTRCVVVLVAAYVFSLVARRLPLLRRVV
ncbi:MAG TPA: acyltransferase family protein [Actinomycetales bacterium]|nr:acyltransferase family protein [Actinomycetales bacterium]